MRGYRSALANVLDDSPCRSRVECRVQSIHEPLLPPRHLELLGEVWDLCVDGNQFCTTTVARVLETVRGSGCWMVVEIGDGSLKCREVVEDLDYLHTRGFVFKTASGTLVPTASAEYALQAAGMLGN